MDQRQLSDLQSSYDRVAGEYARRIFDELQYKAIDRQLLDRLAASVPGGGILCDMGCGPGHVARYLHGGFCFLPGIGNAGVPASCRISD
jgi:hypothetical protein